MPIPRISSNNAKLTDATDHNGYIFPQDQFVEEGKNDDKRCGFTEKLPHHLLDVSAARALIVAQRL
jgi:hypothetical protein